MRGGPGYEFWTPGDERGGAWGSGQNWPLDPPEGGPLPDDPYLQKMWQTFWDGDRAALALEPPRRGAGRLADGGVAQRTAAKEDVFLHVLEIGDRDAKPARRVAGVEGSGLAGAAIEGEAVVLFADCRLRRRGDAARRRDAPPARSPASSRGPPTTLQVTSGFAPGVAGLAREREAGDEGDALPRLGRRPRTDACGCGACASRRWRKTR